MGAEPADGVDGCIREVRKQVGVGADWVKVKMPITLFFGMGGLTVAMT